jgi:ribosomal 30S subunit maturation factor RimM
MITVSSENRDFLIPYVETWIRDVNENSRTLTMDLPEGIIDPENHED